MVEAFGLSDVGCARANNEDYFISDSEAGIFVLADGMGGANAGEFASQLSANSVMEVLRREAPRDGMPLLREAFLETNAVVRQTARERPELSGMGTTLLAARHADPGVFEICSVGDSRAYLFSEGRLMLLTQDQTWVAEVGAQMGLSEEALRKHPMRHVLTMAIGSSEDLRIFSRSVEVAARDQLLLCSDGLHGVLSERILSETLNSEKSLQEKCHYLVEAAKQAGGPDNVTVLLIQVG